MGALVAGFAGEGKRQAVAGRGGDRARRAATATGTTGPARGIRAARHLLKYAHFQFSGIPEYRKTGNAPMQCYHTFFFGIAG
jgi:hypothetical protein